MPKNLYDDWENTKVDKEKEEIQIMRPVCISEKQRKAVISLIKDMFRKKN